MSRREQLESLLQQSPDDPFLRYAVALECAREGDLADAIQRLQHLMADDPHYVPAYLQTAQFLAREDRTDEAALILQRGIAAAEQIGNQHAAGEMQALLAQLNEV